MLQEEFTRLYNKLFAYAYSKAGKYFRDTVLREDSAINALNNAVDTWIKVDNYDEKMAKRVIQSSLRKASRHRELESISIEEIGEILGQEYEGMHGYEIINK